METLTPKQKQELLDANSANDGRLVKSLPCGKSDYKIEAAPTMKKGKNIQGQPILSPIFKEQIDSIRWALQNNMCILHLHVILQGM